MPDAPKILLWDTENSPMLSYHWSRWGQDIRPNQTVEEGRILCFGAKWLDGPYVFKAAYEHGREEMLETILQLLTEAEDGVVSWNGRAHDSRKIRTELVLEGMNPPPDYREIDLMRAVKNRFMFSSNSLDHVSKQLGVGEKVKHEGFFDIIPKVLAGDEKARRAFARYQKQDVLLLEKLYYKLRPWLPKAQATNLALGNPNPACTACGSEQIQWRGKYPTLSGTYRRFQCQSCGKWDHEAKRVETTPLRP